MTVWINLEVFSRSYYATSEIFETLAINYSIIIVDKRIETMTNERVCWVYFNDSATFY
jgi:hypothetical protein